MEGCEGPFKRSRSKWNPPSRQQGWPEDPRITEHSPESLFVYKFSLLCLWQILFLFASPSLKLEVFLRRKKIKEKKGWRCAAVVFTSAVLRRSCPCTVCAALSAGHTRVDSYLSPSYRVSLHSTLCHGNIHYIQTLVLLVVQGGGSLWSFPRLWGEAIFPSWSSSFSNSKFQYSLASGRNIKVVKFGAISFSIQHLKRYYLIFLESSPSLSFSILQSFNSFGESSTAGAFSEWVSSYSSIITLQVRSTFLSLILRGFNNYYPIFNQKSICKA